jgi:hypothetical protein
MGYPARVFEMDVVLRTVLRHFIIDTTRAPD